MQNLTTERDESARNWKRFHELFSQAFFYEALTTASELKLAEAIGEIPSGASEIASRLGLDPESTYRLCRCLAAHGVLEETDDGFHHTSFSRQLRQDHPYSIRPMLRLWQSGMLRKAWAHFAEAIGDGRSAFSHAHAASVYEFLQSHPEEAELFHSAMESNSALSSEELAEAYPFSDFPNVLDLAGGVGTLLSAILSRHVRCRGGVLELPLLEEHALANFSAKRLESRARFVHGNFLEAIPDGFDLYVVKNTLWNFRDEECRRVFQNVRRSLAGSARFLIVEYLVESRREPWSTTFDLQQLNVTGGRGRTKLEYERLLSEVGMKVTSAFKAGGGTVLEARV